MIVLIEQSHRVDAAPDRRVFRDALERLHSHCRRRRSGQSALSVVCAERDDRGRGRGRRNALMPSVGRADIAASNRCRSAVNV